MAFNFKKTFSSKNFLSKDSLKRLAVGGPAVGFDPGSMTLLTAGWDYRAGQSGTRSVASEKAKKAGDIADAAGLAAANAAAERSSQAQDQARKAQADQLAARRRSKRFTYGYDRRSGGGLGDLGGAGGGPKTLLGY